MRSSQVQRRLRSDRSKGAQRALLADARDGDAEALEEAVERFRPMVVRIARRLHGRGGSEELEDLIQVGLIGLLEAIARFDPDRGSFPSYASATVSGTIKRHFRDRSWKLRIPRSLHDAANLVTSRRLELEGRFGRPPSEEELSIATGLSVERVRDAEQLLRSAHPASLQSTVGEQSLELGEVLGAEDPELDRAESRELLAYLSNNLEDPERELLARRFGLEQTQVEIAERLGGSQMRISRRLRIVLTKLRRRAGVARAD
ncbi:MAG TPA: sigma-70 family RNA polymerase sigma factor [Solirubrobacterales bacterium]|nr:sigma-70 family RNA polymerase sigma factor [Solirubrobacterales bacterium]